MKQVKELNGQAFVVLPKKAGGFTVYKKECPYCGKVSRYSIGEFKNGAAAKTFHRCPHFRGWLSIYLNIHEKDGSLAKEVSFIFMPERVGLSSVSISESFEYPKKHRKAAKK